MASTSIECKCGPTFTCGYCLRNMKPYHYALSTGGAIIVIPTAARTITKED